MKKRVGQDGGAIHLVGNDGAGSKALSVSQRLISNIGMAVPTRSTYRLTSAGQQLVQGGGSSYFVFVR